jgi:hypothetical protein
MNVFTAFMGHGRSEPDCHPAVQYVPRPFWSSNIHCRVNISPSAAPIRSQINPCDTLLPNSVKFHGVLPSAL